MVARTQVLPEVWPGFDRQRGESRRVAKRLQGRSFVAFSWNSGQLEHVKGDRIDMAEAYDDITDAIRVAEERLEAGFVGCVTVRIETLKLWRAKMLITQESSSPSVISDEEFAGWQHAVTTRPPDPPRLCLARTHGRACMLPIGHKGEHTSRNCDPEPA